MITMWNAIQAVANCSLNIIIVSYNSSQVLGE